MGATGAIGWDFWYTKGKTFFSVTNSDFTKLNFNVHFRVLLNHIWSKPYIVTSYGYRGCHWLVLVSWKCDGDCFNWTSSNRFALECPCHSRAIIWCGCDMQLMNKTNQKVSMVLRDIIHGRWKLKLGWGVYMGLLFGSIPSYAKGPILSFKKCHFKLEF